MKTKNFVSILLTFLMVFSIAALAGCAAPKSGSKTPVNTADATPEETNAPTEPVKVMALKGPTGMGIVQLMQDENYSVELASAPDDVLAAVIGGKVDIAAVPVNMAAVLNTKTSGSVKMIAVNTLGVLYILENGEKIKTIDDLNGKTLYATGQASTPEYILNAILEANNIKCKVKYKTEHSELATLMASGDVKLGMLPEPNVSAVTLKNKDVRVALDLTEEWNKISDTELVQGCIIVQNEFLENNEEAVKQFIVDYQASSEFVNSDSKEAAKLIEEYGIMASEKAALAAIPNCNIVCMTGDEMKEAADGMFKALFAANPKSIGGAVPEDEFYCVFE